MVLLSIYYLCAQYTKRAQQVILDFSSYLRQNFTAIVKEDTTLRQNGRNRRHHHDPGQRAAPAGLNRPAQTKNGTVSKRASCFVTPVFRMTT